MRILMFSWKDLKHPVAGGAEVLTWEILKGLSKKGHTVALFASRPKIELPEEEVADGIKIYRAGGRYGVYFWAVFYYFKYFRGKFDLIIDQVNTVPFFTPLFCREKKLAFFHQLARQVWFYETRFPISLVGFLLEPFFLFLYRHVPAVTVSPSSFADLKRFGISDVKIISEAVCTHSYECYPQKSCNHDLIYVGRLVPSKRVKDIIEALVRVKEKIPDVRLFVVGNGTAGYVSMLKRMVTKYNLEKNVIFTGYVDPGEKARLLTATSLILVTSVKEGWGLVVTEANTCGTPAVVYNVDGLKDSVVDGETGIICKRNDSTELAQEIIRLLSSEGLWATLSKSCWELSRNYKFEKTVGQFNAIVETL